MAVMKEIYLHSKVAGHALSVIGTGQDNDGADRLYVQQFTLPDGKIAHARDEMTTSQRLQIRYSIPTEQADNLMSKQQQHLRALVSILARKGYVAMWNREVAAGNDTIITLDVVPRMDMGNTNKVRVATQREMALDIEDSLTCLAAYSTPDGNIDTALMTRSLDNPRSAVDTRANRSFPLLRKALRAVAAHYNVNDAGGKDAAPALIDAIVESQYPAENPPAANSHVPADRQTNQLRGIMFKLTEALSIEDGNNVPSPQAFLTSITDALVANSPATSHMAAITRS